MGFMLRLPGNLLDCFCREGSAMGGRMDDRTRLLLNGNEAIAYAALDAGVDLGTGYPGTPSTEILETLAAIGGRAQWAPNEKVAAEVALGVAFANGAALATMKHVGLNVAADPFINSALVNIAVCDPINPTDGWGNCHCFRVSIHIWHNAESCSLT